MISLYRRSPKVWLNSGLRDTSFIQIRWSHILLAWFGFESIHTCLTRLVLASLLHGSQSTWPGARLLPVFAHPLVFYLRNPLPSLSYFIFHLSALLAKKWRCSVAFLPTLTLDPECCHAVAISTLRCSSSRAFSLWLRIFYSSLCAFSVVSFPQRAQESTRSAAGTWKVVGLPFP